ncbi:hypothetical protein, partial [Loktanella sp. 5RATIMAR09]|uniref:hypothetical protein n=1 Tax=Loktanella sp. 5RATIMAR09 TaxID=1225655 RepID=UPI000B111F0F
GAASTFSQVFSHCYSECWFFELLVADRLTAEIFTTHFFVPLSIDPAASIAPVPLDETEWASIGHA